MSYQLDELVHWMRNKDTMKLLSAQVGINLINVCNQDCYYCNSTEFRQAEPVQKKYTEYVKLLDKLSGRRAILIRNWNNKRIAIKNSLAEILNCPVREIKQDHLSE